MRLNKKILLILLAVGTANAVFAFSLLIPFKGYQVPAIGYNLPGDIGGPGNLTEAYRWNVPVITYAFDESFIRYFGTNGIAAIEAAIKILNDIPPVSQIPLVTNVTGFFGPTETNVDFFINDEIVPTDAYGPPNFLAQQAQLYDLKSEALGLLVEEMGLAESERWVYDLRARSVYTIGGVTFTNYVVIQNSFDPITYQPTNVINGVNYGYTMFDPFVPGVADAVEYPHDPTTPYTFSSVSSKILFFGDYYQRLSRDDIGGLRFLLSKNNLVTENLISTGNSTITRATGALAGSVSNQSPWTIWLGTSNVIGTNVLLFTNLTATATNIPLVTQALRPGVDKIRFVRVDFDSLIGQSFVPVTNIYTDVYISNGVFFAQKVQRVMTAPDIVFRAFDLGLSGNPAFPNQTRRTATAGWNNNDAINGRAPQGGPGVITPPITIDFTDIYPFFVNDTGDFIGGGLPDLNDLNAFPGGAWGSFDGTTNAPIVYPEFQGLTVDIIRQIINNNATIINN